jgi:integrase
MASLSQSGNHWSVQYLDRDKRRRTVRLGRVDRMPRSKAEAMREKIEALATAAAHGYQIDPDTAAWTKRIGKKLVSRLEALGLIPECKKDEKPRGPTLAEFLTTYTAERKDVGEGTRTNYGIIGERLFAFFGRDHLMAAVTPGDADRFADHVRAQYAQATAAKTVKVSRQLFRRAVRLKLLPENPFDGVKAGTEQNRARQFFVNRDATVKILAECPDIQWRVIVALARYSSLRCPTEILALTWPDILWDRDRFIVHSPKTVKQGKPERVVPLFPELRTILEEAFELAEPGELYVITRYRETNQNLRTQLQRVIRRAGLKSWPRLFQNLRSSRETELSELFPLQVVTDWLGNTPRFAQGHYLQTTEDHFQRAAKSAAAGAAQALQPALHQGISPTLT